MKEVFDVADEIDHTGTERSLKEIIRNVKSAALRDGYGQLVLACQDGTFSFHRDYPNAYIGDDEKIIGRISVHWIGGILRVDYHTA